MTREVEVRSAADDATRCHVCSYGSMWADDAQGCETCGRGVCKQHWSQCESCPSDVRHCQGCTEQIDGETYCAKHIEDSLIRSLLEATEALVYRALSAPRVGAA